MVAAFRIIVILILSLFVLFSGLVLMRNSLIYVFNEVELPPSVMPRTDVRRLPAFGEDPPLTVWLTDPEEGQPVVLYFMGNSGSLSIHEPRLRSFANAGFGVAAMAYRGGGGQPGRPDQRALNRDALRLYAGLNTLYGREIVDTDRVIYGFSLGAAVAARLASEQEELAVILEAPFSTLCAAAKVSYPVPSCQFFRGEEYDVVGRIAGIDAPLLILHGANDRVIPVELGQEVFDAADEPKFMEIYAGGTHDNLARFGAEDDAISFVRTLRGAR